MTPYAQLPTNKPEEFMRMVGLSNEDFQDLSKKLCAYIDAQKALNPLTKRGRKDSRPALEVRLLLTLYYLEHVNRRCKIFRLVKDVYRGKHKNYSLTWNVVAALVNLRYGCI